MHFQLCTKVSAVGLYVKLNLCVPFSKLLPFYVAYRVMCNLKFPSYIFATVLNCIAIQPSLSFHDCSSEQTYNEKNKIKNVNAFMPTYTITFGTLKKKQKVDKETFFTRSLDFLSTWVI